MIFDVHILGFVAMVFTITSFLPQVIQTWRLKKTRDISLPMYLILTSGAFLWFVYGVILHDAPIIITNSLVFLLASCILYFKIKYG